MFFLTQINFSCVGFADFRDQNVQGFQEGRKEESWSVRKQKKRDPVVCPPLGLGFVFFDFVCLFGFWLENVDCGIFGLENVGVRFLVKKKRVGVLGWVE